VLVVTLASKAGQQFTIGRMRKKGFILSTLSEKQKTFCREYIIDLNGTQAAIRAGYSKKTANEQAAQLLAKLSIKEYVQSLMSERSQRTEITADFVLNGIKDVSVRARSVDDFSAELKSYELLGKHLKMFTDKVDHSFDPNAPLAITVTKRVVDGNTN